MAYDAHEDGRRDFHFLYGRWSVQHRRLKARGVGCVEWDAFAGASFTQGLMDGLCNVEEHDFPGRGQGAAFRTFDVAARRWSIYWVNSATGRLEAPVHGAFRDGVGRFDGEDVDAEGRPVKVRFVWDQITPASARWSQAFSYDDGETWEENWTMAFTRTA
jgi:hypothetical protein